MANGNPTSLRMGFGFAQARAAGAPYQAPPTASQMDWHVKEKAAKRELQKLTKSDSIIREELAAVVTTDRDAAKLSVQDLLFFAKCLKAHHSKTGFIVTGADGKTYESDKMEGINPDGISIIFEGRPFMLWRHYIKSILPR
jgi:hypothetical protein